MQNKFLGYAVAGGILLALANVAPKMATATAGLMLLAVGLTHANQIGALGGWISQATGTLASNQNNTTVITPTGGRPII